MSTCSSATNIFPPVYNPELSIRRRSHADPTLLNDFEMAAEGNGDPPVHDLRTMEELCQPSFNGQGGPIAPISIQATNFGLKNDMSQQVQNSCQFHGLPGDDANKHVDKFLHVTQSIKVNRATDNALLRYLFPHSLTHHATAWFDRMPRNSINTFDQIAKMFLGKYFPPSMVTKLRNEITNFLQHPDESLFKAWEFTVGQTQNVYAARAYQGGNSYQPQDALIPMPKFGPTIKTLLTNKDKLSELARIPLNEHCSALLLKKLPEKLGDPDKFLIPCDFSGMDECLALADLDTEKTLIDVFKGELTLRVGKEAITFNLDQTLRYSANYNDMTANRIDVIDMACEEYSQEVLGFSDMIMIDAFLALEDDPTSPKFDHSYFDTKGDILLLEAFLNDYPSLPPPNQGNYLPQVRKELKIYEAKTNKSSIDEPPKVELKDLPPHLEYTFLEGDDKLPVIIAKVLSNEEKTALITVLKSHKYVRNVYDGYLSRYDRKTMQVFMDNFSVFGNSFETCLSYLEKMLKRCEDTNLCLNWEKSHFMVKEGIVLGHNISKNEIKVDKAKFYVIAKLPHPTTVKSRPMNYLLEKDITFFFSKECVEAFQTLKRKLTEAPILITPDWDLPFELMCDASDFAIECLNCVYRDGKPLTCNKCGGMLKGGLCFPCNFKTQNSYNCYQDAYSFDYTSNNSNHFPQPQYENYLCNLCGNNSHDGYDCQQQFPFVYEQEPSYNQNYDGNYYSHDLPSFPCCDNCGESHETFQCQPMEPNIDFFSSDQIHTPQYPDVNPPSQETSDEAVHAKEDLINSIQTFLEEFHSIPLEEKPQILFEAWFKFFAIKHDQPENSNELFQKLLKDLKNLAEYKESVINSSKEIAISNSNEEKEEPPQESDMHQLIEECSTKVSEEQKQSMEDTMLELVKIYQEKEFLCIHDNVDDLIESALNSKLLLINSNSQRIDKKEQEVKNIVDKEPEHLLSMRYEHLSITPETEFDDVTESNAENLVPIPSECEVTLEDKKECDVPISKNSPICDDHSDIFFDSKIDDDISVYDDDFEDIEYVEASLSDPEIVSVEEENVVHQAEENVVQQEEEDVDLEDISQIQDVVLQASLSDPEIVSVEEENVIHQAEENVVQQEEEEVDLEDISQIQDVVLREKLLSIIRFISNIESLNENPTPDRDNPSIPRPPPEPPDAEIDAGEEILVVMNDEDKFDEDYHFFMFDKDLPSEIEVFLCWIFVPVSKIFTSFD
nr:reverse transcriptase domain-containing protein [Tanacetum cinerariifolium]